jgi:predicted lactoylglutathione lyase
MDNSMTAMHSEIYVNLPVKDLKRSVAFFTSLGYTFNPQFTDENATCMQLGGNLYAMLLTEPFFRNFTKKAITDTRESTEVLTCVACSSREQVDELVAKARAAGANVPREAQDHGFMYAHGYEDLDGHTWELVHMTGAPPPSH